MNRNTSLERINENQEWDIAIIGGGASGLGIAVDAANKDSKPFCWKKMILLKGRHLEVQN